LTFRPGTGPQSPAAAPAGPGPIISQNDEGVFRIANMLPPLLFGIACGVPYVASSHNFWYPVILHVLVDLSAFAPLLLQWVLQSGPAAPEPLV